MFVAILVSCCEVLLDGQAEAAQGVAARMHKAIRQRATNEFSKAVFYKPSGTNENDLEFKLAPLILQEVTPASSTTQDEFGALRATNGTVVLDFDHPKIYFFPDTVNLQGKTHARMTYLWFYSGQEQSPDKSPVLPVQGVRITLGAGGQPVIWEIQNDTSRLRLIYVSEKIEAAAKTEFGPPLPGRKYSVERSLSEAPNSVVVRVIDDGPVPMGPIIYLSAGTRNVSTLICRCMAAQVKELVATRTYDLANAQDEPAGTCLALADIQLRKPASFWPGETQLKPQLHSCLRIPRNF